MFQMVYRAMSEEVSSNDTENCASPYICIKSVGTIPQPAVLGAQIEVSFIGSDRTRRHTPGRTSSGLHTYFLHQFS